ncbi:hypothetical protein INR49_005118 [Caranx melampygus]|nr:hypothetical protein INR49_005118 [Caranx melampygus]
MVDEDCGDLKYCLYEIENSKCLPCIPTDMPCTKDEECCSDQLCVWGQCTVNATAGTEGTICQGQRDCRQDLCCAFQRELLFPVCNPKPGKGESCLSHPNLLMDMLAWDQEGPRDHCPCADSLQCQPQGRGSCCTFTGFLQTECSSSAVVSAELSQAYELEPATWHRCDAANGASAALARAGHRAHAGIVEWCRGGH